MALLTALFISRALQFTKKGATLFCLSAFTVTWIATSASPTPVPDEEEIDPLNPPESSEEEESEKSEHWSPWADDLILKLKEGGLISATSSGAELENLINDYSDYPLSTYKVQQAISTRILQLYLNTQETPQAAYLLCEGNVYPGYTFPPLVFTEEQLLTTNAELIKEALDNMYLCYTSQDLSQKIWIEINQILPQNSPFTIAITPPKAFFEQKLQLANVQITEKIKNFLYNDPDLNTQKNRAQLSELIWDNKTKKHTLQYNFCFDYLNYPVWESQCPPLLELDDLFTLTEDSSNELNYGSSVELHIKDELLGIDRTLMMPPHVAAEFLTKLFPNSFRDYSLIEGGEISFSKSRNAMQWSYSGVLTYGEWNITEEEALGYWPLKILE